MRMDIETMPIQAFNSRQFAPGRRAARGLMLALLALVLLLPLAFAPGAAAQTSQEQHWDRVDVTIQINPDSTFDVTEQQEFVFDQGTFNGSYRDIDPSRMTGISDVSVTEEGFGPYRPDNSPIDLSNGKFGPPHTFQMIDNDGKRRIIWF